MFLRLTNLIQHASRILLRPRAVLALAVVIALPTAFSGLLIDDILHLLTIRGDGFGAGPFDLFRFATGDVEAMAGHITEGPYPWYTWPALKIHFFRPLSSATMVLDYHLFGERFVLYHLHSIAWYALLVWAVSLIYRRTFAAPLAGLCILLYALDDGHLLPVLWWSNRNAIVSVAPAVLGLAAHLRWREDAWRPGLPLSLLGYSLGLLGGETGLGIFGYVAAYELFRHDALATRMRALLPGFTLAGAYLLAYKAGGHGVAGSGVYFDPVGEWPLFLRHAPGRMLDLAGAQFFGLPAELPVVAPGAGFPMRVVALAGLAALPLVFRPLWRCLEPAECRSLAWLGLGALIAAVPGLATFPSGRLLLLPSIGACAWIAVLVYRGLLCVAPALSMPGRLIARLFVVVHIVLAPVAWVGTGLAVPAFYWLSIDAFRSIEIDEAKAPNQRILSLFAPEPYTGFYPVVMRRYLGYAPTLGWQTLSLAPFDHELTRTGANRFELRVLGGEMLSTPFERLVRSHAFPLKAGEVVACEGFRVEVLDAGAWGPRKIALTFETPLEDPKYHFLAWQGGRLAAFNWPAIGETVLLRANEGYFAWEYFKKRLPLL